MKSTIMASTALIAILIGCGTAGAQEITGTPGAPNATTTIDGRYLPNPPPAFGGEINLSAKDFEALLAAADRAAQGRAQRPADHDRRRGLRRRRHVRRRHPDAGARPHRADGAALHAVPLHRALLADAGGADHRPQPSLRRLRRDHRAGHRLSGLRLHHRRGQRHHRQDPEAERLCHVVVRQEPQHAGLPVQQRRPVRPMAVRHGLRVFLRLHGRRHQPVAALSLPEPHPDFPVGRQARLQPHHRHGRRRHRPHEAAERGRARQAVLRLLRARRHPRAAPPDAGMDREVQGQVRHGLERDARRRSSPTRSGSA